MYNYSSYTAQTPQKTHILKSQFPQPVDVDKFVIDTDKFVIDTDKLVIDVDKFVIDICYVQFDKYIFSRHRNIVESGIKHHNPNLPHSILILYQHGT